MRKKILFVLLTLVVIFSLSTSVMAITGEEIMIKVDERDSGNTSHSLMGMDLISADGEVRARTLEMWSITYDQENDLNKTVMEFREPASVSGTRFLQIENKNRDDDKYIYLPSLGRVRRIAASEGDSAFMGSDFTYDDMENRDVEEDEHSLLREETVEQYDCYVVESIPKDMGDSQYAKRIQWISKKHLIPVRVEMYNKKSKELEKVLTVKQNIEKIGGIWTAFSTVMENVETGHKTKLYVKRNDAGAPYIEYNKEINPKRFTPDFLRTGRF